METSGHESRQGKIPGYEMGMLRVPSRMRILTDAGEKRFAPNKTQYASYWLKKACRLPKNFFIPQICCTPGGVQMKLVFSVIFSAFRG